MVMEALSRKSPVPVVLMPHAIAFDEPGNVERSRFGLPEKSFVFLTMYDMHSYQARKNPEGVIEAFRTAFPVPRDVCLVIKVMNGESCPAEAATLRERVAGLPACVLIDETLSREDIYALEATSDCFVSLHRSEGFGLGLAECMYLGKPVIGTHWSGNADCMTVENSCPVGFRLIPLEQDHGPYARGQRWADPDLDEAAVYMRRLVSDASFRDRVGEAGRRTMRTDHAPATIGRLYRKRLGVIGEHP
jgi:glycosyltransferase involved in cell wall biosynthesis